LKKEIELVDCEKANEIEKEEKIKRKCNRKDPIKDRIGSDLKEEKET